MPPAANTGFFCVTGHGVDPALLTSLDGAARRFFALPAADKSELAMARAGRAWRGWFPLGGELTSGRPDQKEGLYFGEELPPDDPRVRGGRPLHGPNLFSSAVPELGPAVLGWMSAMTALGHLLLRGVALGLGLERDWFERDLTREPTVLFRVFRYPPTQDEGWGVGEHTDYGLLTILAQDDRGGLQVRGRDGWIEVPPTPGVLVCNLGDMLDRMTAGRYRSTPHRVRNATGGDRLSFPFFFDPGWEAKVAAGAVRRRGPAGRRRRPLGRHERPRVARHLRRLPHGQGEQGLSRPRRRRPLTTPPPGPVRAFTSADAALSGRRRGRGRSG